MTKDEVRAAIGWVGVIILSPIIGPLLYAIAGVNRIRRASILAQRPGHGMAAADFHVEDEAVATHFGRRFLALKTLGDRVARHPDHRQPHRHAGDRRRGLWRDARRHRGG